MVARVAGVSYCTVGKTPATDWPPIVTDDGVMSPSVRVTAGVVLAVATVPDTPLAVVTDTVVTVPLAGGRAGDLLKLISYTDFAAILADNDPVPLLRV